MWADTKQQCVDCCNQLGPHPVSVNMQTDFFSYPCFIKVALFLCPFKIPSVQGSCPGLYLK